MYLYAMRVSVTGMYLVCQCRRVEELIVIFYFILAADVVEMSRVFYRFYLCNLLRQKIKGGGRKVTCKPEKMPVALSLG